MYMLAQTPVPMLSDPPMLERMVLESPWLAVAGLALLGLLAGWLLAKQGRRRAAIAATISGPALAAAVAITASVVTTTRERLIADTRELIATTAAADITRLESFLAPDLTLRVFWVNRNHTRTEVLDLVRQYPGGQTPVKSWQINESSASVDGPNAARTQVHITTRSPSATLYDIPMGSWWRIEWRKNPAPDDTWSVRGIECLQGDWQR